MAGLPVVGQWYALRLTYDLEAGRFDVIMDSFWPSGDTSTLPLDEGEYLEQIVFRGEGAGESAYYVDSIRVVADPADFTTPEGTAMPLGGYTCVPSGGRPP